MIEFSFAHVPASPQEVLGEVEARRQYVTDMTYVADLRSHIGISNEGQYGMVTWPSDKTKVLKTAVALGRLIDNSDFDCFATVGITRHEFVGIAGEVAEAAVKIRELEG